MLLLLSDLHLGRGTRDQTRAAERDAVALLRAHEGALVPDAGAAGGAALVLLGDVYDQFIEYRHLVPKGAARLVGLLAEWADRGAEVVYVVGNRDPWHVDFFEGEVGARVVDAWETRRAGRSLYIAHGDGHGAPRGPSSQLTHRLQPLLRSPRMARFYRMGLPGDAGYGLARWVAQRFGTDGTPDPAVARRLSAAAHDRLQTTGADVVAFGHSHTAALEAAPPRPDAGGRGGVYLNPGYWFGARTFATLDADGPALSRWADGAAVPLARPAPLDAARAL
ncbi:UDP-2,3-diacylglucosamine diphosphatase [Rubrivirga sp. S365]|uniref:UDP-2,3-diacylglucosamine diphosphatase n=1 Tax=Rubrivirga litoralis TaxID=3075598 RepID=A0ABU3BT80_9BACT|nr:MULTISPECIES: UDP-2,3-diacylglucosamine diphosphatase [unclassified Rubrivirga]MDT0632504.1 UDP-2,3-diacylglucosamine diphosphatase [Rubrivirga sp. F394]MDT7858004.1 UDP-2,3-diacylglucosamine diphosphatase [Rubrivirga sp. S365]